MRTSTRIVVLGRLLSRPPALAAANSFKKLLDLLLDDDITVDESKVEVKALASRLAETGEYQGAIRTSWESRVLLAHGIEPTRPRAASISERFSSYSVTRIGRRRRVS